MWVCLRVSVAFHFSARGRVTVLEAAVLVCVSLQYHNSVRRAIASRCTPEALELADDSNPVFEDTVRQLLMLTRPLSLC